MSCGPPKWASGARYLAQAQQLAGMEDAPSTLQVGIRADHDFRRSLQARRDADIESGSGADDDPIDRDLVEGAWPVC